MRDTRTALLDAAEVLVRRHGYAGVSYADLAGLVGVSKASIHHHFPSKADLALALLSAYDARYDAAMSSILASPGGAMARLSAYAALYRSGVEGGLGCLCAAYAAELASLPDPLREGLARFFAKHVAFIERILVEGRRDGDLRADLDPAAHARLVVATLEGALMMERALDGAAGFTAVLDALAATMRAPAAGAPASG